MRDREKVFLFTFVGLLLVINTIMVRFYRRFVQTRGIEHRGGNRETSGDTSPTQQRTHESWCLQPRWIRLSVGGLLSGDVPMPWCLRSVYFAQESEECFAVMYRHLNIFFLELWPLLSG